MQSRTTPCNDCLLHAFSKIFPHIAVPDFRPYSDRDVALAQDVSATQDAIVGSAIVLPPKWRGLYAFGNVDFIFTQDGYVTVTDLNGSNGYSFLALEPRAREAALEAMLRAFQQHLADVTVPSAFIVPYAEPKLVTMTDKLYAIAYVLCRLTCGRVTTRPVSIVTPTSLARAPPPVDHHVILTGAVDELIALTEGEEPALTLATHRFAFLGRPAASTYDILPARLTLADPTRYAKALSVAPDGMVTQWPSFARAPLINATYELTSFEGNVHRVVRGAKDIVGFRYLRFEDTYDAPGLVATLRRWRDEGRRCVVVKGSLSRSRATRHVCLSPELRIEDVVEDIRKQVAHQTAPDAAFFPLTVTECVPHREILRDGVRCRWYDARFTVYVDEQGILHAIPAFVRYLEVPGNEPCACDNETFVRLPKELARQEVHLPLTAPETLRALNLTEKDLVELAKNATRIVYALIAARAEAAE